ncbi:cyclase [Rhodococcus ruber BKS 20-38]|uniref:Cyclase n=1 Tax=Rhodococcus ruber BKS 20-38 TaxID=1278076 RepID=M3A330_9NOCA|nr:ester cyclase [Rhodococcus ruber]EME66849.1 cyclase [Rhodococcus ruber BKS 20-38]
MTVTDEDVVRRYYEQMNNDRRNDLAGELFTGDHRMHDPQVPTAPGPQGMVDTVSVYQTAVNGHWQIEEIFSAGDRVVVRWTGTGTHVGEINGIPPTGKDIRVDAIAVHRMADGKIAETWEVWDTLGFLQQLGVVPTDPNPTVDDG